MTSLISDDDALDALKYGIAKRKIFIPVTLFDGWVDGCDCHTCKIQSTWFNYLIQEAKKEEEIPTIFGKPHTKDEINRP